MAEIRVAFADTDLMGIVHHSNYLRYFEVSRVAWLKENGINYAHWAKKGLHLPLVEIGCRYRKPARFEDVLIISVKPSRMGARAVFNYEVRNKETGDLLVTGFTHHVTIDETFKIIKMPEDLQKILG
ncbi:MAG: thioesterase family protein [Oligoflexia bacterium]|nr:thioesterase family protein [Oligoflexia bacterium]